MRAATSGWLAALLGGLMVWGGACGGSAPQQSAPSSPPTPDPGATAAPPPTSGAMRFRIASNLPAVVAPQLLPYWVGIESGLFRQQGIGLELVTLQSEQLALTATANGEIDALVATPGPPVLAGLAGGVDMLIVGGAHNTFDQRLIAASDVTEPAAIIGKTAVINQRNTLNDFQTREALVRLGVDPDTDLAGFWVGANQAERVSHLRLGNGQLTVIPPPLSTTLTHEGFVDFGDLTQGPAWPGAAIIVGRRTYNTRFDYVQRFLKGLLASIQRTKADPAFALKVLASYTKIEDAQSLDDAYALYGDRLLERVPYLSLDGLQRALDFAVTTHPAVSRIRPATLVDQTILQRLESSGFVAELYR
jgi:ABC-type nitrate/sulfonate/bicarbonate transport system substrate-binding protein